MLSSAASDGVVARSADQRSPAPGEPSCVVCQRYGEYICDETDDDVCSLECKAVVLRLRKESSAAPAEDPLVPVPRVSGSGSEPGSCLPGPCLPGRRIVLADECVRVKDQAGPAPIGAAQLQWQPELRNQVSEEQANSLRKAGDIDVQGSEVPAPVLAFCDCRFLPRLQANLERAGYESPTPVQMQTIPAALRGRDLLVSAATGSGKTLSYLLPIIERSCRIRMQKLSHHDNRPLALVLTPTRELCGQVEEQAKVLAKGLRFKTALVVGGDAMPQQVYRIENGVELVVGTPGRLIDLLTKHPVELEDICILVLDEVDCMLEQGFLDQVTQLMLALSQPQILMFSATVPQAIAKLSQRLLKSPLVVSVGNPGLPSSAVKQTIIWVESNQKKKKLFEILASSKHFMPPAVVFVNSRPGAELLAESVQAVTGLKTAAVHGEKSTQERRKSLASFLEGDVPLVIATGVLGRGLDLLRVSQVIVFDMPHSLEEYVHQIGRASRMNKPGSAFAFINNDDKGLFRGLIDILRASKSPIPRELANSPYVHSTYAAAYKGRKRKKPQEWITHSP